MQNKIYIEIIRQDGTLETREVEKREPLIISEDSDILCFRYYVYNPITRRYIYDNYNFFNGIRLTKEEALQELEEAVDVIDCTNRVGFYYCRSEYYKEHFLEGLYNRQNGSLCLTNSGDLAVMQNEGDITVKEYSLKDKKNTYEQELDSLQRLYFKNSIKYVMMESGLYLVRPDRKIDWLAFVDMNSDNYSDVIDTIRFCLMELDSHVEYNKILDNCLKVATPKIIKAVIAPAVAYFSFNGISFQQYVNENLEIEDINLPDDDINTSLTFILTRKKDNNKGE